MPVGFLSGSYIDLNFQIKTCVLFSADSCKVGISQ